MSNFGRTIFGGSRFVRISLTPFLLLFAVVMPLAIPKWTPTGVAVLAICELMSIGLLLGFWLPSRHRHWAFRGVAGLVFLGYSGYLIYELFFTNTPFELPKNRGESSPFNALLGLVFIGLPCLWYAIFGRFTLRPPNLVMETDAVEVKSDDDMLKPDRQ